MINEETPDKLAEIIRATWPGLYMRPSRRKSEKLPEDKDGVKFEGDVHQGP